MKTLCVFLCAATAFAADTNWRGTVWVEAGDDPGASRTEFAGAVYTRSERGAVWRLDNAWDTAFGPARWTARQPARLRDANLTLMEDGAENRVSLYTFGSTQVLLPHRKPTYSVRALADDAVEIEQPDTVEVAGASAAAGLHRWGRVSTDADALLAQWTRKFAGPVRVRYVNGTRLLLQTGLQPVALEPALKWKFAAGMVEIALPGGAGELTLRFEPEERANLNLNHDWKHIPLDPAGAWKPVFEDSYWKGVQLPHSVPPPEPDVRMSRQRATNWYRKHFAIPPDWNGKEVFLDFEGVAIKAEVWLNGKSLGEHLGAFNSFRFDITPFLNPPGQDNVLAVRVGFGVGWRYYMPFNGEGFNDYGGIYRDVWLSATDPLHIDSVFVTTPERDAVNAKTTVVNRGPAKRSASLVSIVYDPRQVEVARMATPFEIAPGASKDLVQNSRIANPQLWSPEAPNLYTMVSRIEAGGRPVDRVRNPLGFRWFSFDPEKGFFLNGKHLKLHGANMHQGYPYLYNAVPNSKMAADLHVLKAMGCNFVRMTHITMDPMILELADRLGLMVWEEVPITGAFNSRIDPELWCQSSKFQLREMIRRDRNHPSVILWSMMNEVTIGASKHPPEAVELCRQMAEVAKQEDPTRPTTLAEMPGAYFGVTDVSGRNGYYRGKSLYHLQGALNDLKKEHPEGRYLISEYGAPNVERGAFGTGRTDTEEYGALNHELYVREYEKRPWIAGYTVWTAFDYFRGNPHEGVTDEARYPKDAYYFYQGQWAREPMLQIRSAAHWNFPLRTYPDDRNGDAYDVVVDSNCDFVELFLNGRSQGVREGPGPFVWRQLFYTPGELKAVGRKGSAVLEHTRATAGPPARIVLTSDVDELAADGADVAFLRARVVDAQGRLVANSYEPVEFAVEGEGEIVGPRIHKFLAGVATLGTVRAATKPGTIRANARSGKLKSNELTITTTGRRSSVRYE